MITANEVLLSPEKAGERLGVSVYTVRRWIKEGKLRAFKPGKEYRIRKADLEEFLAAREVRPKVPAPSPLEPSLLNGLEEERREAVSSLLGSWRGMHEESVARWSRAIERGFSSTQAAAAFCAEVIAEGAIGQTIIKRHLIPPAETLLPEDEAARERESLLETHTLLDEAMHAVVSAVEGMVNSETDAHAAAKAIGKYLDQAVQRGINEHWEELYNRPDFELWLRRERRRRQEAGAKTQAQPESRNRERPTA